MKRWRILIVVLLGLLFCGCADRDGTEYRLYYANYHESMIESEEYVSHAEKPEDVVQEIMKRFWGDEGRVSYFSELVQIVNYEINGDILRLDFAPSYHAQNNIEEILTRAAIVKTFTQIASIRYVQFTVNGEPLMDSRDNPIGLMKSDSFLENEGKNISAYQYTKLDLYFANEKGDKLVKESRSVYYTSNSPIEKVVVEQLVLGPKESGHYPTLPSSTGILGVTQTDGIAYVNLDQRFETDSLIIREELPIYSIVNSLIAAGNVSKVQISINGETKLVFRETMNLDQLYEQNLELVETSEDSDGETQENQTEGEPEQTDTQGEKPEGEGSETNNSGENGSEEESSGEGGTDGTAPAETESGEDLPAEGGDSAEGQGESG